MKEFLEVKDMYNKCREEERIKLRDYLIQEGFSGISERGNAGKGIRKYTSGKRLELPLSNEKLERLCQILKAIEPHELALSEIYEKYNLI